MSVDALDIEVFRSTTRTILEELELNITRTSYSVLISEFQDYCVALLTPGFELLAQSAASIPIFISDIGVPVRDSVELIGGPDALDPGDVLITNCARVTGQHLNNVTCATPIYDADGIVGYLAIRSHWADVGGLAPGGQSSASRSIFHEGTQYRGLRVMRAGRIAGEVLATIQANTWQPEVVTGDLMAQIAACSLVVPRWEEQVARRWGPERTRELMAAQFASSAAFARRRVAELPDGDYAAEYTVQYENGDRSLSLRLPVEVRVDGERMVVDLSGMPPQVDLPINSGAEGGATSAVRLAFKSIIDPEWPTDAAFFSPLEVVIPEGTLLSATGDAPMANWNMPMSCIIDLVVRAIGLAHPELVPASHYMAHGGGINVRGRDPDGRHWWAIWPGAGGLGGSPDADGYGPVKPLYLGDNKTPPVEMLESRFPLVCHGYRLVPEAGGAGLHRGGPGIEIRAEVTEDAVVDPVGSVLAQPAQGLAGGGPGQLGHVSMRDLGSAEWVPLRLNTGPRPIAAGTVIRSVTGGGGGWGQTSRTERSDDA